MHSLLSFNIHLVLGTNSFVIIMLMLFKLTSQNCYLLVNVLLNEGVDVFSSSVTKKRLKLS